MISYYKHVFFILVRLGIMFHLELKLLSLLYLFYFAELNY